MPITIGNTTVTFNDSTTQSSARVGPGIQVFTSGGTFTVPAGITAVKVTVFGGGGGGSYMVSITRGQNGGHGGVGTAIISGLTSGASITVTIGSGGNGGISTAVYGVAGGTSSFGSYASSTGGAGGDYRVSYPTSGAFSTTGTLLRKLPTSREINIPWGAAYVADAIGGNPVEPIDTYISICSGGGARGYMGSGPGGSSSAIYYWPGGGGMSGGGQSLNAAGAQQDGYAFGPGANGNTTTTTTGGAGGGSAGGTGGAGGGGGGGTGGVIVEW